MKTMWLLVVLVLLAGCQTAKVAEAPTKDGRDVAATEALRATLAALPRCEAGAEAGRVSVAPTTCTKMYCGQACCNQCGWAATFEGMNAQKVPLDGEKARALLKVGEGALDCEIAAWQQVLSGVSMAVEGTACVVR